MLSIETLSVDIARSRILRGISVTVGAGEMVCIAGPNGAGKTTLLRTIMGQLRPAAGQLRFEGCDLARLPTHAIARAGIAFSPEQSEVFATLTVHENICMPLALRPSSRSAEQRIADIYGLFPKLVEYRERGGSELSGGERKMVSIARAMALDPLLLLLDEPFEGLSPAIIPIIGAGIAAIRARGCSILMTESNWAHIPDYVDRVHRMDRGEIIWTGAPNEAVTLDQ